VLLFYEFDVISTCSRNLLCSSNSSIRRRRSLRLLEMRLLEKRLSFSLCLSHILIFSLQLLHSITSIFNTRMTAVSLSMTQGTYLWQKYRVSSQVHHNCTRARLRHSLSTVTVTDRQTDRWTHGQCEMDCDAHCLLKSCQLLRNCTNKNSSGDEIANVNFYALRPGSYRNSLK